MNRRDFLKGASAAFVPAALPGAIWGSSLLGATAKSSANLSSSAQPITAVIYDERYADCKLFADALVRHGAIALPADADSAQLWYGSLRAHLTRHPGRVAGLATYSDFSVSQSCGRELNLRTMYEGAHDARRSRSTLTHRLRIAGDDREIAAAFGQADVLWAAALADALAHAPAESPSAVPMRIATATTARSAGHPGYLASWLLAPRVSIL